MVAAGATSASAAPPAYDPDPNAYGTITFYDAAGSVVTSGDGNNPQSPKYAVASTDAPVTTINANLALYGPLPATLTRSYVSSDERNPC